VSAPDKEKLEMIRTGKKKEDCFWFQRKQKY
jgi:hypothetical protein